jgi:hypothetical protein
MKTRVLVAAMLLCAAGTASAQRVSKVNGTRLLKLWACQELTERSLLLQGLSV